MNITAVACLGMFYYSYIRQQVKETCLAK